MWKKQFVHNEQHPEKRNNQKQQQTHFSPRLLNMQAIKRVERRNNVHAYTNNGNGKLQRSHDMTTVKCRSLCRTLLWSCAKNECYLVWAWKRVRTSAHVFIVVVFGCWLCALCETRRLMFA